MAHPDVRVLLVTGGPAVVGEALRTRRRRSPPARATRRRSSIRPPTSSRPPATSCAAHRSTTTSSASTRRPRSSSTPSPTRWCGRWCSAGAYRLKEHELRRLERVIFNEMGAPNKPGAINPAWIGKNAAALLAEIGVAVDGDVRLLVAEVPAEHSLVWTEQMMPVMPVVRVSDVDAAIDLAVRSEHGFRHTASIHSTNVDTITTMAPSHELLDPGRQRPELRRARRGRRGVHVVLDRQPDRRGPDPTADLLAHSPGRGRGSVCALSDLGRHASIPPSGCSSSTSIAAGIVAGDAMVKSSPVSSLHAGTVHPGRYLVLVGGDTAAVEIALESGGTDTVVDSLFLADVHPASSLPSRRSEDDRVARRRCARHRRDLHRSDRHRRRRRRGQGRRGVAAGRCGWPTISGGKAYCLFAGTVADVEAAVEGAVRRHRAHATSWSRSSGHPAAARRDARQPRRRAAVQSSAATTRRSDLMHLGRVIGTVVATIKSEGLDGVKFLIVQPLDKHQRRRRRPRGGGRRSGHGRAG